MPEIWPKLKQVQRCYRVVVTCDPWWPAEPFHQAMDQELAQQDIKSEAYHVISTEALEALMPFAAAGVQISNILEERIRHGKQGYFFD